MLQKSITRQKISSNTIAFVLLAMYHWAGGLLLWKLSVIHWTQLFFFLVSCCQLEIASGLESKVSICLTFLYLGSLLQCWEGLRMMEISDIIPLRLNWTILPTPICYTFLSWLCCSSNQRVIYFIDHGAALENRTLINVTSSDKEMICQLGPTCLLFLLLLYK